MLYAIKHSVELVEPNGRDLAVIYLLEKENY